MVIITIFLLLFFPPVGLILVWLKKLWAYNTRLVITGIAIVWSLILLYTPEESAPQTASTPAVRQQAHAHSPEGIAQQLNARGNGYVYATTNKGEEGGYVVSIAAGDRGATQNLAFPTATDETSRVSALMYFCKTDGEQQSGEDALLTLLLLSSIVTPEATDQELQDNLDSLAGAFTNDAVIRTALKGIKFNATVEAGVFMLSITLETAEG